MSKYAVTWYKGKHVTIKNQPQHLEHYNIYQLSKFLDLNFGNVSSVSLLGAIQIV